MSGRIEAGMRLLTVADQSLGAVAGHIDEAVRVLENVTDKAARGAQAEQAFGAAVGEAKRGVAALAAARTGIANADGASVSLQAVDDASTAVQSLHDRLDDLIRNRNIDLDVIEPEIAATRGKVQGARDVLRVAPGSAEVAEDKVFRAIAKETKEVRPESVTDQHIDDVTEAAAKLTAIESRMPTLEEIAEDMIANAHMGKYDNLVGREQEVDQMLTILQRRGKPNPILLGDPGVGKTQLVEGLAVRVAAGEVPDGMQGLKLYSLDAASLKAAAGDGQGGMEKLLKEIVGEISAERERGEQVVLFVDEMHTLMNAGDAAQQLKPALARGDISMIGATTWDEFNKFVSKDGALVRRVAPISVEELTKPQVLDVLRSVQEPLSRHHGVIAYDSAVQEVQRIASRYVRDRKQPDPAIELMDHAMSRVSKSWNGGAPPHYLELANEAARLETMIPSLEKQVVIGDTRAAGQLVGMKERLAEIGPKVEAMSTQLEREREVLGTRHNLVASYLKLMDEGETAAAEALMPKISEANDAVRGLRQEFPERLLTDIVDDEAVREAASNLYGRTISAGGAEDAKRLLALPDTLASRVIGQRAATDMVASSIKRAQSGMKRPNSPAGSFLFLGPTGVGKTETWRAVTEVMTDDVKNMVRIDMGEFSEPHSISKLFGAPPGYVGYDDEPALAALLKNPEAYVLFDEVEKAHPTIFQKLLPLFEEGRVTLGDGTLVDATGAHLAMTSNLPPERVRDFFSPEFLNRLSGVVEFNHLDRAAVGQILDDLLLPKTLGLAAENGLEITVSPDAKERIIDYGFDSAMGARPLQRSLDNHVSDPASDTILQLRAAGKVLDPAVPEQAILEVDPNGTGFIMRALDGEIEIPVVARMAEDHAPGAAKTTHGGGSTAARSTPAAEVPSGDPEWSIKRGGDDAGAAAQVPEPQPQPILDGGS